MGAPVDHKQLIYYTIFSVIWVKSIYNTGTVISITVCRFLQNWWKMSWHISLLMLLLELALNIYKINSTKWFFLLTCTFKENMSRLEITSNKHITLIFFNFSYFSGSNSVLQLCVLHFNVGIYRDWLPFTARWFCFLALQRVQDYSCSPKTENLHVDYNYNKHFRN